MRLFAVLLLTALLLTACDGVASQPANTPVAANTTALITPIVTPTVSNTTQATAVAVVPVHSTATVIVKHEISSSTGLDPTQVRIAVNRALNTMIGPHNGLLANHAEAGLSRSNAAILVVAVYLQGSLEDICQSNKLGDWMGQLQGKLFYEMNQQFPTFLMPGEIELDIVDSNNRVLYSISPQERLTVFYCPSNLPD